MSEPRARVQGTGGPIAFWICFALWLIAMLVDAIYGDALWFANLLVLTALGILGVYLLGWACWIAYRNQRTLRGLLPVVVAFCTPVLFVKRDDIGIRLELALFQRSWATTAERIRSGEQRASGEWLVDEYNPGPVALSRGGLLERWHGYVHDPSGLIMSKRADWFGSQWRHIEPLWGGWYYGWFN